MNHFIKKTTSNVLRFLYVQLFLSLASLPIILSWGLPLSAATAVGNFVFSPFLSLFLLCSSLIFFSYLLHLPYSWLLICLDYITHTWLWCLSWGQKSWLYAFYKPPLLSLLLLTFLLFYITTHKKLERLFFGTLTLCLLFIVTILYLRFTTPHNNNFEIACGKKTVSVKTEKKKVSIYDNGAFASKASPASWVEYTLLSELIKKTGTSVIEKVTIKRVNTFSLQALIALCTHGTVKVIEMPYFENELSRYGWRQFFELQRVITKEKILCIRIK